MLTYLPDKSDPDPLYIQIYNQIKHDIETGKIKKDEKLPSKRSFSSHIDVSIITVENAYNQLLAEGYIRSVPKKGYYVQEVSVKDHTKTEYKSEIKKTNEMLPEPENEQFPFSVWAKLMREELSNNQDKLLTRPPCEGVIELRIAIAEHLKRFRNMTVSPEQIIIGAGTEYLYLLINILFGGNYSFGIEDPGYTKISDIYKGQNIRCEYIPIKDDGIDMDYLRQTKVDILHISPSHHFPTGVVTSIGKRYSLLEWASQSPDRYIIEDDYDSEFRLSGKPIPSMFSIDAIDKIIYMNTFSKSLSSTIRISYMILPVSLLKRFSKNVGYYSCTVSTFEQYTLSRFIREGYFEKHINRMKKYYKDKRDNLLSRIIQYDIFKNSVISGENAGLHCLIKFDTQLSDKELKETVEQYGFKVSLLTDYCRLNDNSQTHTLIFYYR